MPPRLCPGAQRPRAWTVARLRLRALHAEAGLRAPRSWFDGCRFLGSVRRAELAAAVKVLLRTPRTCVLPPTRVVEKFAVRGPLHKPLSKRRFRTIRSSLAQLPDMKAAVDVDPFAGAKRQFAAGQHCYGSCNVFWFSPSFYGR